jgi:hypothetical protein
MRPSHLPAWSVMSDEPYVEMLDSPFQERVHGQTISLGVEVVVPAKSGLRHEVRTLDGGRNSSDLLTSPRRRGPHKH